MNNKPNLVLIPGWGMNSAVWSSFTPLLSSKFNIFTPDFPGYGQSYQSLPTDIQNYTLDYISHELAQQCPNQSIILGWSLGGIAATKIALNYPKLVHKLFWLASTPCFVATQHWPGIQLKLLAIFQQTLLKHPSKTVQRFLALQAMGSQSVRQDIQQIRHQLMQYPDPDPKALTASLNLLIHTDLRAELAQLQLPVHGLFGLKDSLVPLQVASLLTHLIPSFQSHQLKQSAHAPFITEPEQVAQYLLEHASIN